MTRSNVKRAVAVLVTALVLIMGITLPCSALEAPQESLERSTNVLVTFIKDLAIGLKNSFNAFCFTADGSITAEAEMALAYLCTALGVSVMVAIIMIFTKRRKTK